MEVALFRELEEEVVTIVSVAVVVKLHICTETPLVRERDGAVVTALTVTSELCAALMVRFMAKYQFNNILAPK